jgi:hypothetical protein
MDRVCCDPLWDTLLPNNESDLGFVRMKEDNEETYLEGVCITGEEEPNKAEELSF